MRLRSYDNYSWGIIYQLSIQFFTLGYFSDIQLLLFLLLPPQFFRTSFSALVLLFFVLLHDCFVIFVALLAINDSIVDSNTNFKNQEGGLSLHFLFDFRMLLLIRPSLCCRPSESNHIYVHLLFNKFARGCILPNITIGYSDSIDVDSNHPIAFSGSFCFHCFSLNKVTQHFQSLGLIML